MLFLRNKSSHKLSKAGNVSHVGSNNSLYSETKGSENFLNEKKVKTTKRVHTFKGYESS